MARTKEQNDTMKEQRREAILHAALHLFATRGLAATRIADIALAADMAQGLVYHYYPSKEQIFVTLIESAFSRLNAACKGLLLDPAPPHEKIRTALAALIEGFEASQDTARYHLLIATATASDATPPDARAIIERENRYPYTVIEEIIRQGQALGTVRKHNPQELATLFWTTILGLGIHKSSHGERAHMPSLTLITALFLEEHHHADATAHSS